MTYADGMAIARYQALYWGPATTDIDVEEGRYGGVQLLGILKVRRTVTVKPVLTS